MVRSNNQCAGTDSQLDASYWWFLGGDVLSISLAEGGECNGIASLATNM